MPLQHLTNLETAELEIAGLYDRLTSCAALLSIYPKDRVEILCELIADRLTREPRQRDALLRFIDMVKDDY